MEIKFNPDPIVVEMVKQLIKENRGYCPCSVVKNKDTKCICKEFRQQKSGYCHCELYYKTED